MRRVRYMVATSLDGYIAGPEGEFDWIIMDPEIDFGEIFARFDTILVGRRTFEMTKTAGGPMMEGVKVYVFSRTLPSDFDPQVTLVGENWKEAVTSLRSDSGKDIWLFGGGLLFRSLLDAGLVDTVEVAVVPILLGGGIPLLPPPAQRAMLKLSNHRIYKTGIVGLEYAVA